MLPDPRNWEDAISMRKKIGALEYHYGSAARVPPIGLHAIMEGQARFSQLQYLSAASGGGLRWDNFKSAGMFGPIYVEAFNLFLKVLGLGRPDNLGSPEVSLFLLICDIAINPVDGFPIHVSSFDTFLDDVDPGTRFWRLCVAATKGDPAGAINRLSRDEYLEIAGDLCKTANLTNPMDGLNCVERWTTNGSSFSNLLSEGEKLHFLGPNMALRLIISKFLAFCNDKKLYPEFFCWPGLNMVDPPGHEQAVMLFQKHQSLFTNRSDKRGIFPRVIKGITPDQLVQTLTEFYQWNVIYDLVDQWILEPGVFDLPFDWLTESTNDEIFHWSNRLFENVYGVRPDQFTIL